MKKLLFLILLTLPCVSISQTTNRDTLTLTQPVQNYEPLQLPAEQVFNVYVGLKQGERYKIKFRECSEAVTKLDSLIQSQNKDIADYAKNEIIWYQQTQKLYEKLIKNAEEIQKLNDVKWWKSPWLYLVAGFIGGVLMMK